MVDFLYTITALELFLGGGGRLLELGSLTVRMLLFAACLIATLVLLMFKPANRAAVLLALGLVSCFLLTHVPALLIGMVSGMAPEDIFTDLSPLLYWLIAPFFAVILTREHMVRRTAFLLQATSVTLALMYLGAIAALALGVLDFTDAYPRMQETGEFFFRGEGLFFYKGFLYLGLGVIFLAAIRGPAWKILIAIVITALVLTLTRGFILATAVAGVLMLLAMARTREVIAGVTIVAVAAFMVWVALPSQDDGQLLEQRDISTQQRFDDLDYMVENVRIKTSLIGEGLGAHINGRLAIENSYLGILWKIGPVALLFWLAPIVIGWTFYRRVPPGTEQAKLACAFYFGLVLVYVQTATNPYLNNPIGLSFVLMAVFSLRTLATANHVLIGRPTARVRRHRAAT